MDKKLQAASRVATKLTNPPAWIREYKVKRRIHRELRDDAELYSQYDQRYNEETKTPTSEKIQLSSMWATEFYTPRHFANLRDHLEKLDAALAPRNQDDPDLVRWFTESQRSPFGQRWTDAGHLKPAGLNYPFLTRARTVPMPPGVAYATGTIGSASPRIKYAVIRFVFDSSFAAKFQDELDTYRSTMMIYRPYGASIRSPDLLKRENIDNTRVEMSRNATKWFREHLPGLFAERKSGDQIPICEFIEFNDAEPFPELSEPRVPVPRYLNVMGLGHSPQTWQHPRHHNAKFSSRIFTDLPHHHSTVTITHSKHAQRQETDPSASRGLTVDYSISQAMTDISPKWSALAMLESYEQELNKIHTAQLSPKRNRTRSLSTLENLGQELTWTADIEGVIEDVVHLPTRNYGHEFIRRPDTKRGTEPIPLSADLEAMISERAQLVKRTLQDVRRELLQHRDTISISASIRLQRTMKRLALASFGLALVAIGATVFNVGVTLFNWDINYWASKLTALFPF